MAFSRISTWRVSRRRWTRWRQRWMSFKGRLRRLDDKLERVKAVRGRAKEWPADPVEFCVQYLGFKPTVYQEKLLRDPAQSIVGRWSRQSGKTHCVAVLLLWSCLRNRGLSLATLSFTLNWLARLYGVIALIFPTSPRNFGSFMSGAWRPRDLFSATLLVLPPSFGCPPPSPFPLSVWSCVFSI